MLAGMQAQQAATEAVAMENQMVSFSFILKAFLT